MKNVKTNKEMFMAVLSVIASATIADDEKQELTDFVNGRIEQIDKKANTVSKADKAKAELNAQIATQIIDGLTLADKPIKVSDLIKQYEPLNGYSTQKLTPIMTGLVKDGKIKKSLYKRETLYSI
jgi:hypothetical protein